MLRKITLFAALCLLCYAYLPAQNISINPKYTKGHWPSAWITATDALPRDYGIYHFRKTFELANAEESFVIHVSADNRYILYVNGEIITRGPARGDLHNWYFESVDIGKYLKKGKNTLAATVWNMGTLGPVAQITNQTGFVVQGDTDKEQVANTNSSWKATKNESYTPCSTDNGPRLHAYMVIGPGDQVDASKYPWGWEQPDFDDSAWNHAVHLASPSYLTHGTDNLWNLTPRNIPLMEESFQRMKEVRKSTGITADNGFLTGKKSLIIPPNQSVKLLIDQGHNTVVYPVLKLNKGAETTIQMTYTEALLDKNMQKGNRNEIEGRDVHGNYDIFIADGGDNRTFSPLWIRTFRYLELAIQTKEEALEITDLYGLYSGYPFEAVASFKSNDASMDDIWEVGWRTARLCAGETYYDCPYYEQLQYPGDTRVQALISLYVTGDDRLMKKAILDFYNSRVPEGLTQGRYPSSRLQVIPPYSLYWISMIYDFWMHRQEDSFIKQFLPAINGILFWYEQRIDEEKQMLGPMEWWNFTDYTDVFPGGVAPGSNDGNSSLLTMHYAYTLKQAAALYNRFELTDESLRLSNIAKRLSQGTLTHCFDRERKLMADTPEKSSYSQHASIMGVLSETIANNQWKEVMKNVVEDPTLGPVTFYYRFYLTQALKKAGLGDLYYPSLQYWRDMLAIGLTTFAEKPEPARSDCHAWSASPLYDYFAVICGINPISAGFKHIEIAPSLGELKEITASMPHPDGSIEVSLKRKGKTGIEGSISLPNQTVGTFVWQGKTLDLKPGTQHISL